MINCTLPLQIFDEFMSVENSILLIDEVESILGDRNKDKQSDETVGKYI